jgi:dihydrofolate synthase / folylpolyglutamate synthase
MSELSQLSMDYASIYTPEGYDASYESLIGIMNSINSKICQISNVGFDAPTVDTLQQTNRLYSLIGKPLDSIPTIHVGGTNGKGTTCYKLSQFFINNKHQNASTPLTPTSTPVMKTGLFVSPHISCYRERITLNGKKITKKEVLQHLPGILLLCSEHKIAVTMFEITFILACKYYQHHECDVVVLEVGLGGEADATNVIKGMFILRPLSEM